jgi:NAD(P)H-dependent FMN reductase
MLNLKIILATTRPSRRGPAIATWIYNAAQRHKELNVELFDLAVINLPLLDEPHHPRFQNYTQQHTKDWSEKISSGDAFIIVTAEYNHGIPASLKNALDYVYKEWNYKPVAFVSYGGIAGGTRCVQMLKQVTTALKMIPIVESVNIPFFEKYIDEQHNFKPEDWMNKAAEGMFSELLDWAESQKSMREKKFGKPIPRKSPAKT